MTTLHYEKLATENGQITLSIPNTVIAGDGFYISFNDHDTAIYGCETTALVFGQMERFYVLKGDHREQYQPLIASGFDACFAYFERNKKDIHPNSEQ